MLHSLRAKARDEKQDEVDLAGVRDLTIRDGSDPNSSLRSFRTHFAQYNRARPIQTDHVVHTHKGRF
jgi:hypothetical protein